MGVPALFRWLSRKYPKIISDVIEEEDEVVDGTEIPSDYRKPNPNGELDNLYLDMNGIVHPCSHPEGRPAPETEDDMMLEVFKYTDRVVRMARPRKVLMIAVDGVAPRAKMNQQRSRRFRSALDAKIASKAKQDAIDEAEARGQVIDDAIKDKKHWDSNAITPGTPFMDVLARSLRYWVSYKLNNDPEWKDLKVIISDATVPGEGEHKIMEFIRSQRCDPSHNPNTSHCMYGLDADLIFLGLATHEPHFRILREDVFAQDKRKRNDNQNILDKHRADLEAQVDAAAESKKSFIWLHVDILRQYLEVELAVPRLPFPFDFERAIDDWVFMCFFVGNDFLPHLPCLDVRDNSIDLLLSIWKQCLPRMGGYMTCDGNVNLARTEVMIQALGLQEAGIFRKRRTQEIRRMENEKRRREEKQVRRVGVKGGAPAPVALSKNKGERAPINPLENMPLYDTSGQSVGSVHMSNSDLVANRNTLTMANAANKSAAEALKAELLGKKTDSDITDNGESTTDVADESDMTTERSETPSTSPGIKRKAEEQLTKQSANDDYDEPEDNIRLWEPGYRERYYQNKFQVAPDDEEFRKEVVARYVEGICWTLLYYYQGCPSWTWFYPYHYAPFAADFKDLSSIKLEFSRGKPFKPFEQLMSVMPATSGHTLPEIFRPLMSDPKSDIIDFYPEEFPIDMNGKKMSWQGIALLPFIDEKRLLDAVQKVYPQLTEAETNRNQLRDEILLVNGRSKLAESLKKTYETDGKKVIFGSFAGQGLGGIAEKEPEYVPGAPCRYPLNIESEQYQDIEQNDVLIVQYHVPTFEGYHNKSMLLNGVILKESVLSYENKEMIKNGGRRDHRQYSNGYNNNDGGDNSRIAPNRQHAGGYRYYVQNPGHYEPRRQSHQNNNGYYQNNGGYQRGYQQHGNYQSQNGYQHGNYQSHGSYQSHGNYQSGNYQSHRQYQNGYRGGNQYQQRQDGSTNNAQHNSGEIPAPNSYRSSGGRGGFSYR